MHAFFWPDIVILYWVEIPGSSCVVHGTSCLEYRSCWADFLGERKEMRNVPIRTEHSKRRIWESVFTNGMGHRWTLQWLSLLPVTSRPSLHAVAQCASNDTRDTALPSRPRCRRLHLRSHKSAGMFSSGDARSDNLPRFSLLWTIESPRFYQEVTRNGC